MRRAPHGALTGKVRLLAGLVLALAACGSASQTDWRAAAVAKAEAQLREETGDPGARFSAMQVTGDQSSGQVCGKVTARNDTLFAGRPARFIFYIDGSPGWYLEGGNGPQVVPSDVFEVNWRSQCIGLGYPAS